VALPGSIRLLRSIASQDARAAADCALFSARLRPDLAEDRLQAATMSVFGMLNWFFLWHRPGKGLSRGAYADLVTDLVIGGLPGVPA
jgi:hypothetical protein